jgi:hypothetical protein
LCCPIITLPGISLVQPEIWTRIDAHCIFDCG